MRCLLLTPVALAACQPAPVPRALANTAPFTSGCPSAAQVLGAAQQDEENWRVDVGKHLAQGRAAHPAWLLHETVPPCAVHAVGVDREDLIVTGACEPKWDDLDGATDWIHAPFAVGGDFASCRVVRPRMVQDEEHLPVPDVVRRTMTRANAMNDREIELNVVGNPPVVWEVGSLDWDTLNRGVAGNNCPHPSWVFVQTPDGVQQLDVQDAVDGILVDRSGARVVLVTPYGWSGHEAYDIVHLPPHRAGVQSTTSAACIK